MHKYLRIASHISIKGSDLRRYRVGAVGVRRDGTVVYAWNGSVEIPTPCMHAEARLVKKLDYGSVVYVARTRKDDGKMAIAKPCKDCERVMRRRGVRRCEYSINDNEFGVLEF
jgi:cytidine deaminase